MSALSEAFKKEQGTLRTIFPTSETAFMNEIRKQNEKEHASHVAVRMNSRFQVEYYNELTGEIVSCHC